MGNCCGSSSDLNILRTESQSDLNRQLVFGNQTELFAKYNLEDYVLGQGSFGTVYRYEDRKDKNHKVAIKAIDIHQLKKNKVNLEIIRQELDMLQNLVHPNIVRFKSIYLNSVPGQEKVFFVMEYLKGYNLKEKMQKLQINGTKFTEAQIFNIMKQLLLALCYMHGQNIAHRDIKPANIMLVKEGMPGQQMERVKLIDMGIAVRMKAGENLTSYTGTPLYMSPQQISRSYDQMCDMWAVGCILYEMVCGQKAFKCSEKILECNYNRQHPELKAASEEVRDLISKLLVLDPKDRLSANLALHHEWFQKMEEENPPLERSLTMSNILQNLSRFEGQNILRKFALKMYVDKYQDDERVKKLKDLFNKLDKNNNGLIDVDEIQEANSDGKVDLSAQDIAKLICSIKIGKSDSINYEEFIYAGIGQDFFEDDEKIQKIFDDFKSPKSDTSTKQDIIKCFDQQGIPISAQEIEGLFREIDLNRDKRIDFEEFKELFIIRH